MNDYVSKSALNCGVLYGLVVLLLPELVSTFRGGVSWGFVLRQGLSLCSSGKPRSLGVDQVVLELWIILPLRSSVGSHGHKLPPFWVLSF